MVNSAEPGFKSAKNDLFVLTHCEFLKCNAKRKLNTVPYSHPFSVFLIRGGLE